MSDAVVGGLHPLTQITSLDLSQSSSKDSTKVAAISLEVGGWVGGLDPVHIVNSATGQYKKCFRGAGLDSSCRVDRIVP